MTNSKSEIIYREPRAGEVERLCCSIVKAKKYGFYPKTDFIKDLGKYVRWYSDSYKA